jgi:hypothetical protein
MSENCEYYGRIYYNGEMWQAQDTCEHCACNFGQVTCMNIQCESKFCMSDEIMISKKDECCIRCRKLEECIIVNQSGKMNKIKVAGMIFYFG